MDQTAPVAGEGRSRGSRLLWGVDRWAGSPLVALGVLAAVAMWLLISAVFGFPDSELRATRRQHRQIRQSALNEPSGGGSELLRVLLFPRVGVQPL
jgi:hypothetical protein